MAKGQKAVAQEVVEHAPKAERVAGARLIAVIPDESESGAGLALDAPWLGTGETVHRQGGNRAAERPVEARLFEGICSRFGAGGEGCGR